MTTAKKLFKDTTIVSSASLLLYVIGFFVTLILIRSLGKYDYGLFVLIFSIIAVLASLLDLGLNEVVAADIATFLGKKDLSKIKKLLIGFSKMQFYLGIIVSLIMVVGYFISKLYYPQIVSYLILASLPTIIFTSLKNIYLVVFYSHSNLKNYSSVAIIEYAIRLISIFIFLSLLNKGIVVATLIYSLSTFFSLLILTPPLLKNIKYLYDIKPSKTKELSATIKGHGKYVIFLSQIAIISANLPYWIVKLVLGVEFVAIYSVAYKVFSFLSTILSSLRVVILPIISEELSKDVAKVKEILYRSSKYTFYLTILAIIISSLVSPILFPVLFPGYESSILAFLILIISLIPTGIFGTITKPLFYATKMQQYQLMGGLTIILFTILFSYPLIALFGINGMAISFMLGLSIAQIIQYLLLKKSSPELTFKLRKIFTIDKYDKNILKKIF